jgi:hypothetical protein
MIFCLHANSSETRCEKKGVSNNALDLIGCERENVRTTLDVVLNIEDPYLCHCAYVSSEKFSASTYTIAHTLN